MSLDLGWDLKLPMAGPTDGIFSIQVLPWYDSRKKYNPQLMVQTESGRLFLLDAENGEVLWTAKLDSKKMLPVAANSHALYVVRNDTLYIFDRVTGEQQLFWYDTKKGKHFGMLLQSQESPGKRPGTDPAFAPPVATPAADEESLFYTTGDSIVSFGVPNYPDLAEYARQVAMRPRKMFEPVPPKSDIPKNSPRPQLNWVYRLGKMTVATRPAVTPHQVCVVTTDGHFISIEKNGEGERFRFNAKSKVAAALGRHETPDSECVYIASEDQMLYAFDLKNGNPLWRFIAGGALSQKPNVNDSDIYLMANKVGMYRIDRRTGNEEWVNKKAHEFLAANRKFVYTRDARGSLQIHDRNRGEILATYNVMDWRVSVANEWTDRIYLANNDGLMMCLFLHDNQHPVVMKAGGWKIRRPDWRRTYECKIVKIDPEHVSLQTWDKETHKFNPVKECRLHREAKYYQVANEKKEVLEKGLDDKAFADIDPDIGIWATAKITDETVTEISLRKAEK